MEDGPYRIEQIPGESNRSGLAYHVSEIRLALSRVWAALRCRAKVALIVGGHRHWYLFSILSLFGVRVIPSLHVMLWPKWRPLRPIDRLLNRLNGWFFARAATAIVAVSDDIADQVRQVTNGRPAPLTVFRPSFREEDFPVPSPPQPRRPFRVLFVGRISREKGVFDLLAVAGGLRDMGRADIEFDLCGTGEDEAELRRRVDAGGLGGRVRLHGHCERPALRAMYERAHMVVVPTKVSFVEGLNKVVFESVMAGRPVLTSSVCPAVAYVGEAALVVPADDTQAYLKAILELADDPALARSKAEACLAYRREILGAERTYGSVLDSILAPIVGPP